MHLIVVIHSSSNPFSNLIKINFLLRLRQPDLTSLVVGLQVTLTNLSLGDHQKCSIGTSSLQRLNKTSLSGTETATWQKKSVVLEP